MPWLIRTLGLTALAGLVAIVASPAGALPINPIQPGDDLAGPDGYCTLNFVFDGGGKVYVGTAAHCGKVGQSMTTSGYANFGTFRYDDDQETDFALIEVKPEFHYAVSAEVRGHPGLPKGSTSYLDTTYGDVTLFSGFGMGFEYHPITREERLGALVSDTNDRYCLDGPVIFGDSGGPILHQKTGKALGVVSHLGLECFSSDAGPTIQGALAEAASRGFNVNLRSVP